MSTVRNMKPRMQSFNGYAITFGPAGAKTIDEKGAVTRQDTIKLTDEQAAVLRADCTFPGLILDGSMELIGEELVDFMAGTPMPPVKPLPEPPQLAAESTRASEAPPKFPTVFTPSTPVTAAP